MCLYVLVHVCGVYVLISISACAFHDFHFSFLLCFIMYFGLIVFLCFLERNKTKN